MNLKPEEISAVIRDQIKNYKKELEISDFGTVIQYRRRYCAYIWFGELYGGRAA